MGSFWGVGDWVYTGVKRSINHKTMRIYFRSKILGLFSHIYAKWSIGISPLLSCLLHFLLLLIINFEIRCCEFFDKFWQIFNLNFFHGFPHNFLLRLHRIVFIVAFLIINKIIHIFKNVSDYLTKRSLENNNSKDEESIPKNHNESGFYEALWFGIVQVGIEGC